MPIKLLHHKSWHVWKKDNIAKVKRDEQKHEEEQKRKRKKDRKNEGERILKKLRQNAGQSSSGATQSQSHVNLFEPEEEDKHRAENEEYVDEEKKRKERELRRAGIAPLQLGGQASKHKGNLWYNLAPDEEKPTRGAFGHILERNAAASRKNRDSERKDTVDPMLEMNKYIEQTKLIEREHDSEPINKHRRSKNKHRRKDSKRKKKGKSKKKDKR
mmetsp:Transcript_1033/g.1309  ORF Transcript_1033/g.1309 Transcript_1033/m.1309 type:complete len:215 (-) Transcript_1033:124-768(-)